MEMGPVIVVNFQAQQIAYIADAKGKVVEGDPVSLTLKMLCLGNEIFSFEGTNQSNQLYLCTWS